MKFDEDLINNSNGALETLVCATILCYAHALNADADSQIRAGMSIGRSPDQPPYMLDMQKSNVTQEEKRDAQRRIEGSLVDMPSDQ